MSDLTTSAPRSRARWMAEAAFHQGNPGPRMELWSRRDQVTLFGAAGMYKSGWDELSRIFSWVSSRFSHVTDYSFEVLVSDVVGDMAYAIGYERFTGSTAGRPVEQVTVRSTHIYRREEDGWKIVHRHGDNPQPDPSPPQDEVAEDGVD